MSIDAKAIVHGQVEEQFNRGPQTVGRFVDNVEQGVRETVEGLRLYIGDEVDEVAGEAIAEAESFRAAKLKIFNPEWDVKDTEADGAAAWNDKSDNSIAVGFGLMSMEADHDYGERVGDHEEVHQQEQAAEFDRSEIVYPGGTVSVHPTLVEWHAITMANQPMSDLTPDYRQHKEDGDALVAYIGREAVVEALRTGKMSVLQNAIVEKMIAEQEELKAVA